MRVVRLCSVFQSPATALTGRGVRFDPIGGMQSHTHQLSLALDRLGVAQTVVTTRPPTAPHEEALGAHGRVIRLGLGVPWFRQLYSWPAARVVPRLVAQADLLHVHLGEDLAVVPIAMRAVRRTGRPFVLTIHTSVRHTLAITGPRSAFLKVVGGGLELRGVGAAAAVITLVPRLADLVRQDGCERPVYVIPSGVAAPRAHGPSSAGLAARLAAIPGPRVVFVGRLHPQKHVDVLVRALAQLPGCSLVLAGDGPERGRLERLAHRLGIADRVHFLGFLPHDDIPAVLATADVFVMPSRYEELGTALLEAMQAGLPIVASATGGIPQVIEDGVTGLLVPPGAPAALAEALGQVLSDHELATRLGQAGARASQQYEWSALASRVLAVYTEVLGPRDDLPKRLAQQPDPEPI